MKTQEKTPKQKTPIFENSQKKHQKKNTNSEIRQKKHPTEETPIFENGAKGTQKKNNQKNTFLITIGPDPHSRSGVSQPIRFLSEYFTSQFFN